jgi:AraC-like DNA-binding protein
MHSVRPLYRSPTIFIGDVICRSGQSGFGETEVARSPTVILPRSGVFVGRVRGRHLVCDPSLAVFLDRHETYRVSHPTSAGDRCTVFCLSDGLTRQLLRDLDERAADCERVAFQLSHAPTAPRADGLHRRLVGWLSRRPTDDAGAEEIALELVGDTIATGLRIGGRPAARRDTGRRRDELVEEAKEILATSFTKRLALAELAAELECSPYHLCRTFRQCTGITVHRYQLRLRLRAAAERIALGERGLARLACELGFADHSHFTHAFREETGQTPSGFQCSLGRAPRPSP